MLAPLPYSKVRVGFDIRFFGLDESESARFAALFTRARRSDRRRTGRFVVILRDPGEHEFERLREYAVSVPHSRPNFIVSILAELVGPGINLDGYEVSIPDELLAVASGLGADITLNLTFVFPETGDT